MSQENGIRSTLFLLILILFLPSLLFAESCEQMVRSINRQISPGIDEQELVEVLRSLNKSNNNALPPKFLTKKGARSQGWKPGKDLWSIPAMKGFSIGGDRFRNHEGRLAEKIWREADLDYHGGHRGGKRIVLARDGERQLTVDHYKTFLEVPECR